MSISLKVVSIAAVFCAAFRRSAIRLLKRLMRARTSRSPETGPGGGWAGAGARAAITSAVVPALFDQLADGRARSFKGHRLTLTRLAPLGPLSRIAGEGGSSPQGWVSEGIRRSVGNPAEHRPDGYIGAFLGKDLGERAGSGRGDFERNLVGFELGDGLVGSDR